MLVRKDVDVNEHERLFNFTLTEIKVKEQHFYCSGNLDWSISLGLLSKILHVTWHNVNHLKLFTF